MANIRPFRAWRYNSILAENLEELTAPMSETVLQQKQASFYRTPYHYFHISSPIDSPPFENVQRRVQNWQLDKVILQDTLPAIYVYAQYFTLHREEKFCIRKGFICQVEATDYDEKAVLPHENTIAKAVEYRQNLLEHTRLQTLPTHGLYEDKDCLLEHYLAESLKYPLYEVRDKNDSVHQLSVIQDRKVIEYFLQVIRDKQIIIADGHHRYESSVSYRKQCQTQNPAHIGEEPYNFHLMWLTNTAEGDAGILPTHRIAHSLTDFSESDLLAKLRQYFTLEEVKREEDLGLAPCENLWTFMLILREKNFLLRLRPEVFVEFKGDLPEAVKRLDLSVLHHFLFEKCIGLSGQAQFQHLDYSQYVNQCYKSVAEGQAQFAVLTRRITFEEIQAVCQSDQTMPAKATYFFPKVLGGLVFSSL
jgi:uncharacterized protein (DUF1015 family)